MVDAWADDELDERVLDEVLLTGEAVALDLRPTGFVLSAAGAAIDFVVYLGGLTIVLIFASIVLDGQQTEDATLGIVVTVAFAGCLIIAPGIVELLSHGKSLGRLAVGARIVRDDGGAIGFRHALIRSLAGFFEFFVFLGFLAMIVGLLSPRSQRLGDLMAGTYSQYERVGRAPAPVFGLPVELVAWATIADVARMPDGLSRRIAQFLGQAGQLEPSRRHSVATDLAAEARAYVSPVPSIAPELFLAGVTVVRRDREAAALAAAARRLEVLGPALRGMPHGFPDRG